MESKYQMAHSHFGNSLRVMTYNNQMKNTTGELM
jgi:hypothetical protein